MNLNLLTFSLNGWLSQAEGGIQTALQSVSNGLLFILHFVTAALAVLIVVRCGRSLLKGKIEKEVWGFFCLTDGTQIDLLHWENTIGRARGSDIVLNNPTVSRSHGALTRNSEGEWTIFPLNAKNGILKNGVPVDNPEPLEEGDVLTLGEVDLTFFPSTKDEERRQAKKRTRPGKGTSPTLSLILVTVFQAILCLEMFSSKGAEYIRPILLSNLILCGLIWGLYLIYRVGRRRGFEVETLAYFLTSICLLITASKFPEDLYKQVMTAGIGIVLFFGLTLALRDLDVAKKLRWPACCFAVGLFVLNLALATVHLGAKNWIKLGPLSFQPSEIVKICFVLAGMATLDRLFSKRNLVGTVVFSAFCVGCLGLMSDFGTALIFFVAFLVVAFLRTGDLPSVVMVIAAAVFACVIIIKFKPYILERFSVWRHVWEDTSNLGYQQTRTMSAIASGGLFGLGGGKGFLNNVAASSTDLVFGMVAEQLGLIVALCTVACIVIFALFAVKSAACARSSFYVIGASAVAAMFVTQTMLNVFGCTDLLPLTGVTLPFVSTGGSSMMSCWALLAYIKAADTRQNSSFAVKLPGRKKRGEEEEAEPDWQLPEEDEEPTRRVDPYDDSAQFDSRDEDFHIDFDFDEMDDDYDGEGEP